VQALEAPTAVTPKALTVIEGAYSMHPDLSSYYDLSAFLKIDPDYQRERILKRNTPDLAKRFFEEWIPMEKIYFEGTNIETRCDVVISVSSDDFAFEKET
jgi:uridine kinase